MGAPRAASRAAVFESGASRCTERREVELGEPAAGRARRGGVEEGKHNAGDVARRAYGRRRAGRVPRRAGDSAEPWEEVRRRARRQSVGWVPRA